MPQKRSGVTAGLEESGGSAGGAECSVTARRARCHASSQLPDRVRARGSTTMTKTAAATVPRATPPRLSRRAGPPRAAPSAPRAPSTGAPRRRRSPRAILARRSASRELRGAAENLRPASPPQLQRSAQAATHLNAAPPVPLPPLAGSPAPHVSLSSLARNWRVGVARVRSPGPCLLGQRLFGILTEVHRLVEKKNLPLGSLKYIYYIFAIPSVSVCSDQVTSWCRGRFPH